MPAIRNYTRRDTLAIGVGAAMSAAFPARAITPEPTADEAIAAFTAGSEVTEGGVTLTLPDIAEDGYKVALEVSAPGAEEIMIIAPANPIQKVASFRFGQFVGAAQFSTRIRLADTQEVSAFARMPDGSVYRATRRIEVLVGGCA